MRDQLAIFEVDAAVFVDVNPQQVRLSLSAVVEMNQFHPLGGNDLFDLVRNLLRQSVHIDQNKKSGRTAAFENELLESRRMIALSDKPLQHQLSQRDSFFTRARIHFTHASFAPWICSLEVGSPPRKIRRYSRPAT